MNQLLYTFLWKQISSIKSYVLTERRGRVTTLFCRKLSSDGRYLTIHRLLYPVILHITLLSTYVNLDQKLQCSWDTKSFGHQATLSPEQKQREQQKDGRLVIRLPLNIHSKQLVKSRQNGRTKTSAD